MATRKKRHENSRCVRGDSVYTRSCSRRHTKKPKDTKKIYPGESLQHRLYRPCGWLVPSIFSPSSYIHIYIYIYKCFFSLSLSLFSLASFTRKSLWATLGPASDLSSSYCLPVVLFFFFSSFFFFSLFFSFVGEYQKNIYIPASIDIVFRPTTKRDGKERRLCDK